MTSEEYAAYVEQYYASYVADEYPQQSSSSSSSSSSGQYNNSNNVQQQGEGGNTAEEIEYDDPSSIVASVFRDNTVSGTGNGLRSSSVQGVDVSSFVGMDKIGSGTGGMDAIVTDASIISTGSDLGTGVVSEDILRRKRFLESMLSGK
jgi:hypothetical protein